MLAVCLLTFIAMSIAAVSATTPTLTPQYPNGIRQCASLECPLYTQLEEFGHDMWKRRYDLPGMWVYKVAPTCNISAVPGLVYTDINNYFVDNGINKTIPLSLRVVVNTAAPSSCPDQSESIPCCDKTYEAWVFIPLASQATAPIPSQDSGMEIWRLNDPVEFYGITFSGLPFNQYAEKYAQLCDYLDAQSISYNGAYYFVEIYDAPSDPQPFRNEITIPVTV